MNPVGHLMPRQSVRRVLALCMLFLGAGACSRSELTGGIQVTVIDESQANSPFGAQTVRAPGQGMDVFLVPHTTPLSALGRIKPSWTRGHTDAEGRLAFVGVEGRFHILVDANGDGAIDKRQLDVFSGRHYTITVTSLGNPDDGDNWMEAYIDKVNYFWDQNIEVTLLGYQVTERTVALEIWHDGEERLRVLEHPAGTFSGEVSYSTSIPVARSWTPTSATRLNDYLLVPLAEGNYYSGNRFSVRELGTSTRITGMSLTINGGDPETNSRNVTLAFTAQSATFVAFHEDLAYFDGAPVKFPFSEGYGFGLSAGAGMKTVYAMFYDADGNYAGPVSDTIRLNDGYPRAPSEPEMYTIENPPGMHDFLYGTAGAVEGGRTVRVYGDRYLARFLGQTVAAGDGSFGPINIGDGSIDGNVEKPWDYVYVVARDFFGRESVATPVINDSTAPPLWADQIFGHWLNSGTGKAGDTFEISYTRPSTVPPDVTGGFADLSQIGGPSNAPLTHVGSDRYTARYTVSVSDAVEIYNARVRMRLFDAAMNISPWVTGLERFIVDTVPPHPPTILKLIGDNREMRARWTDTNGDLGMYHLTVTNESGAVVMTQEMDFLEYCAVVGQLLNCLSRMTGLTNEERLVLYATYSQISRSEDNLWQLTPLPNCQWYHLQVSASDRVGNMSPYSEPVSARVILPPPDLRTWGGLSAAGSDGIIVFSTTNVENASAYELHFSDQPDAPYSYVTLNLESSPRVFAAPPMTIIPNITRISGFPLRTLFYMATRSQDGACLSDYSAEFSAATDLRIESIADGKESYESMGGALALGNDVDGDTWADLAVGAMRPRYVAMLTTSTGARIGEFGIFNAPDSYDIPGTPLATADLDGDGKLEYIVGSPLDSPNGIFLAGTVRVYDDDFSLLATMHGDFPGLQLGFSVANVGDLDGDGHAEFAAGGFGCANRHCGGGQIPSQGPGKVIIYSGATLAPLVTNGLERIHVGNAPGDYFGVSIAGGLDLNGDGVPDYVIGSPGTDYFRPPVYVSIYSGATGNLLSTLRCPLSARCGAALAVIPDVDGDGLGDIVVGAPARRLDISDEGYQYAGNVLVYASRWDQPRWWQSGYYAQAGMGFGAVIAAGGDVNGDGTPDVIVGAPGDQQNFFYGTGAAYALDGVDGRFLYELIGGTLDGAIGFSALSPGDLNGGGADEWVIGAPGSAYGDYQAGRVYILTTDP
jgi:hypothetical protein